MRAVRGNHTIRAIFDCPSKVFSDVDVTSWSHGAIDYVTTHHLISGVTATEFAPNADFTRAQAAMAMAAASGADLTLITGSSFADVDSSDSYAAAIEWANANGVAIGYGDGMFGPGNSITREQFVTICFRKYGSAAATMALTGFTDADQVSEWAADAVSWAVSTGLMTGNNNQLRPRDTITREEAAALLMELTKQ